MTSCTETDVLKETKRKIPLSPKNANNIDNQISRIVSKLVLFKFPSRYSLPFIYFDTKQACHLSEEKEKRLSTCRPARRVSRLLRQRLLNQSHRSAQAHTSHPSYTQCMNLPSPKNATEEQEHR